MANYAQAFFHREWNQWTVGFYDSSRAGRAESYQPCSTETEARRVAAEFNDRQPKGR